MKYECKHCGTEFALGWGPASCPKCATKDVWITGGKTSRVLIIIILYLLFLAILYLLAYVAFFGGVIGGVVALPAAIWSILKKRKP